MLFGFCILTALLKLSQISGPVSSRLQFICLPEQTATLPSAAGSCIATGWGQASRTGPLTAKLLEARIPLQTNSVCRSKYGHSVPIRAGHLCAGHLDGSTGTCVVSGSWLYQLCWCFRCVCVFVYVMLTVPHIMWCWQLQFPTLCDADSYSPPHYVMLTVTVPHIVLF
jgi:hypothetical protein